MSEQRSPTKKTPMWQYHDSAAHLPLNLIGGGAGRITRQVFDRQSHLVTAHPQLGFRVHKYYFLTETKLESNAVDLWQVGQITLMDPGHARVTLHHCALFENDELSSEISDEALKQKYRELCIAALNQAKGN